MRLRPTLAALAIALSLGVPWAAMAQPATPASVAQHYGQLVHASYEDTLAAAKDMQAAIHAFLAAPSAQTLGTARERWLAAREFYGQTEAFRFYGGPIDDDHGPEGRLNAWPLDESYVDYVQGKPRSGFIGDAKFRVTKASIAKSNERGGEENVSAGWHASWKPTCAGAA